MTAQNSCQYLSEPYFEELRARVAADEPPNVGYVDAFRVVDLATSGSLAAVDDEVDVAEVVPASLRRADAITHVDCLACHSAGV